MKWPISTSRPRSGFTGDEGGGTAVFSARRGRFQSKIAKRFISACSIRPNTVAARSPRVASDRGKALRFAHSQNSKPRPRAGALVSLTRIWGQCERLHSGCKNDSPRRREPAGALGGCREAMGSPIGVAPWTRGFKLARPSGSRASLFCAVEDQASRPRRWNYPRHRTDRIGRQA